jgi:hypothetical protein
VLGSAPGVSHESESTCKNSNSALYLHNKSITHTGYILGGLPLQSLLGQIRGSI